MQYKNQTVKNINILRFYIFLSIFLFGIIWFYDYQYLLYKYTMRVIILERISDVKM